MHLLLMWLISSRNNQINESKLFYSSATWHVCFMVCLVLLQVIHCWLLTLQDGALLGLVKGQSLSWLFKIPQSQHSFHSHYLWGKPAHHVGHKRICSFLMHCAIIKKSLWKELENA